MRRSVSHRDDRGGEPTTVGGAPGEARGIRGAAVGHARCNVAGRMTSRITTHLFLTALAATGCTPTQTVSRGQATAIARNDRSAVVTYGPGGAAGRSGPDLRTVTVTDAGRGGAEGFLIGAASGAALGILIGSNERDDGLIVRNPTGAYGVGLGLVGGVVGLLAGRASGHTTRYEIGGAPATVAVAPTAGGASVGVVGHF
jgi:hypothetical protein